MLTISPVLTRRVIVSPSRRDVLGDELDAAVRGVEEVAHDTPVPQDPAQRR